MPPTVTVLQLDTHFPRVPGDVACAHTYCGEVEIVRIPCATVKSIVSNRPDLIDVTAFESAIDAARGEIIVTSCGFLSYWQKHLQQRTHKIFISSALIELEHLSKQYLPEEVLTLTFDEYSLTALHFNQHTGYASEVIGLPEHMLLRRVIAEDLNDIDVETVAQELIDFISTKQRPSHKHLLLECTNLPPYKDHLRRETGLGITDILTCIESARPNTICSQFLT